MEEHQEAVEFDLIGAGLRWAEVGSARLSWRDLWVLVRRWQKVSDTATCEAVHGAQWDRQSQLLAAAVDVLAVANWQRAGDKNNPRPKPIPRPGVAPTGVSYGSDPIPISEFDDWWESKGG